MPDKSTHLNFSVLYLLKSKVNFNPSTLILGTLAPDLVWEQTQDSLDIDEEFKKSHFLDDDKKVDLHGYTQFINFPKIKDINEKSFFIGYYCHLWLDNYFESKGKELISENIDSIDKKKTAKNNIMHYNIENTREFFNNLIVEESFDIFKGFESITFDRLYKSYSNYIEFTLSISSVSSNDQILIEKSRYDSFINEALSKFIEDTKLALHNI